MRQKNAIEKARATLVKRKQKEEIKKDLLNKDHLVAFQKKHPEIDKRDIIKAYLCASAIRLKDCPEDTQRARTILIGEDYYLDFFGEATLADVIEKIPRGDFKFPKNSPKEGHEDIYNHYQLLFMNMLGAMVAKEEKYNDNHFLMNLIDRSVYNLVEETCEEYIKRICLADEKKGYITPRECKKIKFTECDELVKKGILLNHCAFWITFGEEAPPRIIYLHLVNGSNTSSKNSSDPLS